MKYPIGLVVGKFCPLHKGHEFLIATALQYCDHVVILSYTSNTFENCSEDNRREWLKALQEQHRLTIKVFENTECPLDESPEHVHRYFCSNYISNELNIQVQAVFTSEEYGPGFAEYLGKFQGNQVVHCMVDLHRNNCPISGTRLRENFDPKFVSDIVRSSFVPKILFIGAESTGKTTLVNIISDKYGIPKVMEYGRQLYDEKNGILVYDDMLAIAKEQIRLEDEQTELCLCDTSALTTSYYSQEWFGYVSKELQDLVKESYTRYNKIFVCAPDFPMIQDGTRQNEDFRSDEHRFLVRTLFENKVKVILLFGSLDKRIQIIEKELGLSVL